MMEKNNTCTCGEATDTIVWKNKGIIVPPPDCQATVPGHPCLSFGWKLKMAANILLLISRLVPKLPRRVKSCGVPSCDVPKPARAFIQSQCSERREEERGVKDGLSSSPAARIPHTLRLFHTHLPCKSFTESENGWGWKGPQWVV